MVATFAAVTTLLTAAKNRTELIAAAQTIQHVGCIKRAELRGLPSNAKGVGLAGIIGESHTSDGLCPGD